MSGRGKQLRYTLQIRLLQGALDNRYQQALRYLKIKYGFPIQSQRLL